MSTQSGVQQFIEYVASPEYADHQLTSTDRSVLRSKHVELIPRESSTFGYQVASGDVSTDSLNSRATFNLSDPRHYVDLKNSYFQCEFTCNAATNANVSLEAFFENGGIHAAIKTLIVRHGSAEIHRIENYNKLYNMMNLGAHSREYRNRVLGDSGDSYEDQYVNNGNYKGYGISFQAGAAGYTAATKILTLGNAGAALTELQVGDMLSIGTDTVGSRDCYVTTIIDDDNVTVDGLGGDNILVANVLRIQLKRRGGLTSRRRIVQTDASPENLEAHRLTWQMPVGFFMLDQYLPLPFMNQNIEIILEFAEPSLCIVVPPVDGAAAAGPVDQGALTNKLGYKLSKFRFVANMIEPSGEIFEAHRKLWKEDGLVYRILDHRSYEQQLAASGSQYNFTFQTNIKSVQSVLAVSLNQAEQSASGNNEDAQQAYNQSDFLKDDLADYRFRVGGLSFPDYGSVNVDDVASGQAWKQLQHALGVMMDKQHGTSIESWEWADRSSKKFIIGMLMAKEQGVYNTGADISGNYLELELNYNSPGPATPRTLFTFLNYDEALVISEKSGVRLYF